MAIKNQLKLTHRFLSNKGFEHNYVFGNCTFIKDAELSAKMNSSIDVIRCVKWTEGNGSTFKINQLFVKEVKSLPSFGKICAIFISEKR